MEKELEQTKEDKEILKEINDKYKKPEEEHYAI